MAYRRSQEALNKETEETHEPYYHRLQGLDSNHIPSTNSIEGTWKPACLHKAYNQPWPTTGKDCIWSVYSRDTGHLTIASRKSLRVTSLPKTHFCIPTAYKTVHPSPFLGKKLLLDSVTHSLLGVSVPQIPFEYIYGMGEKDGCLCPSVSYFLCKTNHYVIPLPFFIGTGLLGPH